jgi:hypothetical protein
VSARRLHLGQLPRCEVVEINFNKLFAQIALQICANHTQHRASNSGWIDQRQPALLCCHREVLLQERRNGGKRSADRNVRERRINQNSGIRDRVCGRSQGHGGEAKSEGEGKKSAMH